MHSWAIFRNGCRPAAEDGYDAVIASHTRRFGPDHPDTLRWLTTLTRPTGDR